MMGTVNWLWSLVVASNLLEHLPLVLVLGRISWVSFHLAPHRIITVVYNLFSKSIYYTMNPSNNSFFTASHCLYIDLWLNLWWIWYSRLFIQILSSSSVIFTLTLSLFNPVYKSRQGIRHPNNIHYNWDFLNV